MEHSRVVKKSSFLTLLSSASVAAAYLQACYRVDDGTSGVYPQNQQVSVLPPQP